MPQKSGRADMIAHATYRSAPTRSAYARIGAVAIATALGASAASADGAEERGIFTPQADVEAGRDPKSHLAPATQRTPSDIFFDTMERIEWAIRDAVRRVDPREHATPVPAPLPPDAPAERGEAPVITAATVPKGDSLARMPMAPAPTDLLIEAEGKPLVPEITETPIPPAPLPPESRVPVPADRQHAAAERRDGGTGVDRAAPQIRTAPVAPLVPPKPEGLGTFTPDLIAVLQICLSNAGYDPGPPDGSLDDETRDALNAFALDYGLPANGQPTESHLEAACKADRARPR